MILTGNWKMNPGKLSDAEKILNAIKILSPTPKTKIWIAPPNLYFYPLKIKFSRSFDFGLQNVFFEEKGAFTGEISPVMAKNLGAKFIILGHSERKKQGETLENINKKVNLTLKKALKVILCFGESKQPSAKNFNAVINEWQKQLNTLLSGISKKEKNLILAFEPSWAISSQGIGAASKEYLEFFINWYRKKYKFPIFYGGSVNSNVLNNYLDLGFQGFLIGSASLKINEMKKILKILQNK